ncbi:MAG: GNAT family N-acetyltransferase [Candidatus Aenigmatarchaeota archaeon]
MKFQGIGIKEAKKDDFEALLKLWKKATDYHHKLDKKRFLSGEERENFLKKRLKEFLAKKRRNRKILLAVKKEKPIGLFIASIRKSPNYLRERKIGEIEVAFIEEKFRRKGIGKMLFEELVKWFKKRKINLIEVLVDSRNEIGISAYKKYGFKEVAKRMALTLSE